MSKLRFLPSPTATGDLILELETKKASITAPNGGEIDRVSRYKWPPARGHGVLRSIHKDSLSVDPSYQRDFKNHKAVEIASKFSWISFGALIVAKRPNGTLWVIDGQHRHAGALKRSDITELPCVVYELEDVVDEAGGFLEINKSRKPLTAMDTHRAFVMKGDEAALRIEALARKYGYTINPGTKVNSIRCVGVLRRLYEDDRPSFEAAFTIAAEICRGRHFDERIIDALAYLYRATDGKIEMQPWRGALAALGFDGIKEAAAKAAAFYARGGPKVWARGVAQALNKGRSKNFLEVPE